MRWRQLFRWADAEREAEGSARPYGRGRRAVNRSHAAAHEPPDRSGRGNWRDCRRDPHAAIAKSNPSGADHERRRQGNAGSARTFRQPRDQTPRSIAARRARARRRAVQAGQVVARMDTQDLAASLHKAEAQVQGSQQSLDEARAKPEPVRRPAAKAVVDAPAAQAGASGGADDNWQELRLRRPGPPARSFTPAGVRRSAARTE